MNQTVYVPDAVWTTARMLFPNDNPSALATRAFGSLVRENNGLLLASIVSRLDAKDRERIDAILDEDEDEG